MMMSPTDVLTDRIAVLEKGWNAGDGAAYAAPFAPDADFVDIRGIAHSGRAAIGAGHQGVLDTIYANSTIQYHVEDARLVNPGVIVGHVRAELDAPQAPPMPSTARATVVLADSAEGWLIAAFHNTLVTG